MRLKAAYPAAESAIVVMMPAWRKPSCCVRSLSIWQREFDKTRFNKREFGADQLHDRLRGKAPSNLLGKRGIAGCNFHLALRQPASGVRGVGFDVVKCLRIAFVTVARRFLHETRAALIGIPVVVSEMMEA